MADEARHVAGRRRPRVPGRRGRKRRRRRQFSRPPIFQGIGAGTSGFLNVSRGSLI